MISLLCKVLDYWSLESRAERVWNSRTDAQIINSYKDNRLWLDNLRFLHMSENFSMYETINTRYNKYIKPQMDKRDLWSKV